METEKTGYLGELPFENYRDDIVKLPDLYINAFANSGFLVGDFENRIKSLSSYLENQPDVDHLSEQFSKIIVMELLEKIIIHITQGRTQKLKEGGFLFESFLALLLSGTAPVDSKSYIDLIDNKLNNISIKFSATKSSFYQAFSTVEKYFQTNRQPMIHIMAVKTKVSAKENSIIDIHRSEFTYDDYLKVLEALKKSRKSYAETDKAHVITKPKSRYTVENDWETATATIKFGKGKYETGNQPRITFKQYGEKITTLSLMPPKAMRQFSKEKMDSYDENIDLLFKELTALRKNSAAFFSVKESEKQSAANNVAGSYKNLRDYIRKGFKSREVKQSLREDRKNSKKDLDKLKLEVKCQRNTTMVHP
jgi:hypothetical protein